MAPCASLREFGPLFYLLGGPGQASKFNYIQRCRTCTTRSESAQAGDNGIAVHLQIAQGQTTRTPGTELDFLVPVHQPPCLREPALSITGTLGGRSSAGVTSTTAGASRLLSKHWDYIGIMENANYYSSFAV